MPVPELSLVEVLDPAYLADLDQLTLAELRAKRDLCVQLETGLSYLRRLAQARIDLVAAESERRRVGAAAQPEALVGQLTQILAEGPRAEGPGRLPTIFAPAEGAQSELAARLEAVCPSEKVARLEQLAGSELGQLLRSLSALESKVSSERRALHAVQDRLEEELVRRYRSGEATVDTLLG